MGIFGWFTKKNARSADATDVSDIDRRLLDDTDKQNMQTSLHIAAASNQLDVASELLRRGVDVNAQNKWGATPLHLASSNDNYEMAELLLRHKAKTSIKNNQGNTPLMLARALGRSGIESMLTGR